MATEAPAATEVQFPDERQVLGMAEAQIVALYTDIMQRAKVLSEKETIFRAITVFQEMMALGRSGIPQATNPIEIADNLRGIFEGTVDLGDGTEDTPAQIIPPREVHQGYQGDPKTAHRA